MPIDLDRLESRAWGMLVPQPPPNLWEWASTSLILPMGESSALMGFDRARAGLFARMLRVISARRLGLREGPDYLCEQCWCVCAAQLGKTVNLIFSTAGWHVRHWPHVPIGVVWPTIDVRKQQLKGRVEPFFQATPTLLELLPEIGSENYIHAITERLWKLENGAKLRALVGNIANDCRSNPLAVILADEFDALKDNVGKQGDPLQLLIDRQRTFRSERIIVGTTTPSTVFGHGWRRLCSGTHERLLVRCACNGLDYLNPDQLRVTDETLEPKAVRKIDGAHWHCRHCGTGHDTDAVRAMVTEAVALDRWCPGTWEITDEHLKGIWQPAATIDENGRLVGHIPQSDDVIRSFHLSLLYSPLGTLGEFLAAELTALAGRETDRQAHWNTARAEPWIPTQQDAATDEERAAINVEGWGIVPDWATHLVLMFDQQGNQEAHCWFPWVVRAFGPLGRSQQVDCGKIEKAVTHPMAGWGAVEMLCDKAWPRSNGQMMTPTIIAMDNANGNMGARVRQWASYSPTRRMLFWGAPKLRPDEYHKLYIPGPRARLPMPYGVQALEIHSTHWRDELDGRRRQTKGFPEWRIAEGAPAYYLRSIWESEERVLARRNITSEGVREVAVWKPTQQTDSLGRISYRKDNHWWDLEVGALAIADHLGWCLPPRAPAIPVERERERGDWVGSENFEL